MRCRSLATMLVLFLTLAHAGAAAGASKPKCKRPPKGHAHSAAHHRRCPTNKDRTKREAPETSTAPTPTPPASLTPPTAPTPGSTSPCPTLTPLPPVIAGQTTIVGYAQVNGGPLDAGHESACPRLPGGTDPILLESLSGQTLQSQSPGIGQPFDFVVEPGEYYVVEEPCTEGPQQRVVAVAGEQNRIEVGCNIP
jgi:hypothetical protein